MVRLRQGDRAGMEPDRSFPPAAGYAVSFKVRVSYTVETDGTGDSVSAWSKPAEGYVRMSDHSPATRIGKAELLGFRSLWWPDRLGWSGCVFHSRQRMAVQSPDREDGGRARLLI
jgi:hypothetical protein